jgi:hypothetical protein
MTPEQTLDWLAEQHKSQCNEDRPVQEWIRSMKSMLPEPVGYVTLIDTPFGDKLKPVLTIAVPVGSKLYTAPPAPVPLTLAKIRAMWGGKNGLEDCDLCKFDDFVKVVRFIESASDITEKGQP